MYGVSKKIITMTHFVCIRRNYMSNVVTLCRIESLLRELLHKNRLGFKLEIWRIFDSSLTAVKFEIVVLET